MAYSVRVFGYAGVAQIEQNHPKQYTADTVFTPDEPCLWSQVVNVAEGAGAESHTTAIATVPDNTKFVCVEVPAGKAIRYEVQPQGPSGSNVRTAGNASRSLSGFATLPWGRGYTLSMVDAAFYP